MSIHHYQVRKDTHKRAEITRVVIIVALRQEYCVPPCCKENTRATEAAIDSKAPRRSNLFAAYLNVICFCVTAANEFRFGKVVGITMVTKMNAEVPSGAFFFFTVSD